MAFRSLRHFLRLTDLTALAVEPKMSGRQQMVIDDEDNLLHHGAATNNLWASICDVNACLEAVTSQSTFMSQFGGMSGPLPSIGSSAIAVVQQPDKFRVLSIPWKSEFVNFEVMCKKLHIMHLVLIYI